MDWSTAPGHEACSQLWWAFSVKNSIGECQFLLCQQVLTADDILIRPGPHVYFPISVWGPHLIWTIQALCSLSEILIHICINPFVSGRHCFLALMFLLPLSCRTMNLYGRSSINHHSLSLSLHCPFVVPELVPIYCKRLLWGWLNEALTYWYSSTLLDAILLSYSFSIIIAFYFIIRIGKCSFRFHFVG